MMSPLPSRILCVALLSALSLIGSTFIDTGVSRAAGSATAVPVAAIAVPLASSSSGSTAFEKEVLALVNKARSSKRKCGSKTYAKAKALKWNGKLALAAERHSADMSSRNYFSHTTKKTGKSPGARIKAAGYKYKAMGETLAAGHATPKAVVNAWLKSTAHCKILMSKSYTQLGVGYYSGKGRYVHYTTADFGKPK